MERFVFDLQFKGNGSPQHPGGLSSGNYLNSFMKLEFGHKLIEEFIPRWDLRMLFYTSGAYISRPRHTNWILFAKTTAENTNVSAPVLGINNAGALLSADPRRRRCCPGYQQFANRSINQESERLGHL